MIQVFSKQWFAIHQNNLVKFANTALGRKVLRINDKRKIWKIMPNALYFLDSENQVTAEFRTHDKYGKRLYYQFKYIWELCHWFDMNIANVLVPQLNLGFDTLTAYPSTGTTSPSDGPINRVGRDETFAVIQAGAGNQGGLEGAATDVICGIRSSTTSNQFAEVRRAFFNFDTSTVLSTATVTAVTFGLNGVFVSTGLGNDAIDCVSHTAGSTTLPASDFVNIGTTQFATITSSAFVTGSYNNFALNSSGIANINKTGISKYALRMNWDRSASFGGTWASNVETRFGGDYADVTGTTTDPKLTVTYTPGGGGINYGAALLFNLM